MAVRVDDSAADWIPLPDAELVFGLSLDACHAVTHTAAVAAIGEGLICDATAQALCGELCGLASAWGAYESGSRYLSRAGVCQRCVWIVAGARGELADHVASTRPKEQHAATISKALGDFAVGERLLQAILNDPDVSGSQDSLVGRFERSHRTDLLALATGHSPRVLVCDECSDDMADGQRCTDESAACLTCTPHAGPYAGEWQDNLLQECIVDAPCSVLRALCDHYGITLPDNKKNKISGSWGPEQLNKSSNCSLPDAAADESGQDTSRWLVITPEGQKYLDAVVQVATSPPGVVWLPDNGLREPNLSPFELYDSPDEYPWCEDEVWEAWHDNPKAFRAIRVIATGEVVDPGLSSYEVVEDRLLRDFIIDPARREYSRLREVACTYGSETFDPNMFGTYGPGVFNDRRNDVIGEALNLLQEIGGFGWLLERLECMGTTDPYVALALRPHIDIDDRFDQQSYDALRWDFEAHRGELLHPDDPPLADISYKPVADM